MTSVEHTISLFVGIRAHGDIVAVREQSCFLSFTLDVAMMAYCLVAKIESIYISQSFDHLESENSSKYWAAWLNGRASAS